jgi:ATP-dependent protease ClpP protease subunit
VSTGARVRLDLGQATHAGPTREVAAWAHELEALALRFAKALAEDCGRHLEEVEHDLHAGRTFDAAGAVAYGIADAVISAPQS